MQEFHASINPTLGVEWEVALIDPVTRDLVSRAGDVVALVKADHPEIHLEREFLANTVELVTPICRTVPEAVDSLETALAAVKTAAASLGLKLWGSGSHLFSIAQLSRSPPCA